MPPASVCIELAHLNRLQLCGLASDKAAIAAGENPIFKDRAWPEHAQLLEWRPASQWEAKRFVQLPKCAFDFVGVRSHGAASHRAKMSQNESLVAWNPRKAVGCRRFAGDGYL